MLTVTFLLTASLVLENTVSADTEWTTLEPGEGPASSRSTTPFFPLGGSGTLVEYQIEKKEPVSTEWEEELTVTLEVLSDSKPIAQITVMFRYTAEVLSTMFWLATYGSEGQICYDDDQVLEEIPQHLKINIRDGSLITWDGESPIDFTNCSNWDQYSQEISTADEIKARVGLLDSTAGTNWGVKMRLTGADSEMPFDRSCLGTPFRSLSAECRAHLYTTLGCRANTAAVTKGRCGRTVGTGMWGLECYTTSGDPVVCCRALYCSGRRSMRVDPTTEAMTTWPYPDVTTHNY